jgi:hypothetical protein
MHSSLVWCGCCTQPAGRPRGHQQPGVQPSSSSTKAAAADKQQQQTSSSSRQAAAADKQQQQTSSRSAQLQLHSSLLGVGVADSLQVTFTSIEQPRVQPEVSRQAAAGQQVNDSRLVTAHYCVWVLHTACRSSSHASSSQVSSLAAATATGKQQQQVGESATAGWSQPQAHKNPAEVETTSR